MIFDILSSKISMSRWQDRPASISISFDVVPHGRGYLEFGDDYILAAAGYLPMRDQNRKSVEASVTITCDPSHIEHLKADKPICGYAQFN